MYFLSVLPTGHWCVLFTDLGERPSVLACLAGVGESQKPLPLTPTSTSGGAESARAGGWPGDCASQVHLWQTAIASK